MEEYEVPEMRQEITHKSICFYNEGCLCPGLCLGCVCLNKDDEKYALGCTICTMCSFMKIKWGDKIESDIQCCFGIGKSSGPDYDLIGCNCPCVSCLVGSYKDKPTIITRICSLLRLQL